MVAAPAAGLRTAAEQYQDDKQPLNHSRILTLLERVGLLEQADGSLGMPRDRTPLTRAKQAKSLPHDRVELTNPIWLKRHSTVES